MRRLLPRVTNVSQPLPSFGIPMPDRRFYLPSVDACRLGRGAVFVAFSFGGGLVGFQKGVSVVVVIGVVAV
ncbi:UNVERIFIED_CONTAM: hypothetical protein RMT77_015840 [Armadillidium vulgare]